MAQPSILPAQTTDIPPIQHIVTASYTKYISRIGKPPAPMTADYAQLLTTHDVFVLRPTPADPPVGSIVLRADTDRQVMNVNNLVVDPAAQGKGFGKALLRWAEQRAAEKGCREMALFTNVKMVENFGLYARMGYEEVERRTEEGFERVFFRKVL